MHERKVESDRGCGLGIEMVLQQARPMAGNEGHSWWLKGAVLKVRDGARELAMVERFG